MLRNSVPHSSLKKYDNFVEINNISYWSLRGAVDSYGFDHHSGYDYVILFFFISIFLITPTFIIPNKSLTTLKLAAAKKIAQ